MKHPNKHWRPSGGEYHICIQVRFHCNSSHFQVPQVGTGHWLKDSPPSTHFPYQVLECPNHSHVALYSIQYLVLASEYQRNVYDTVTAGHFASICKIQLYYISTCHTMLTTTCYQFVHINVQCIFRCTKLFQECIT